MADVLVDNHLQPPLDLISNSFPVASHKPNEQNIFHNQETDFTWPCIGTFWYYSHYEWTFYSMQVKQGGGGEGENAMDIIKVLEDECLGFFFMCTW